MTKLKYVIAVLLAVALLFSLTACRQRITDNPPTVAESTQPQEPDTPETTGEPPDNLTTPPSPPPEDTPAPPAKEAEDEQFNVEINMTEPEPVLVPGDTGGTGVSADGASGGDPPVAGDSGGDTVVLTEPSDTEGATNLSDEGEGTLGTIIDNYTTLLSDGLGSLYECEKGYVYYEAVEDFQTVNRASPEHSLIIESGGYNVAEKLNSDALVVDSGWVLRKNPTVIVKCVDAAVLGGGVTSTGAAAAVADEIFSRPGLEGAGAVINRSVVLISQELLSSNDGRLLAKIYIANAMYPSLFSNVEIETFFNLIKESGGVDYTGGLYAYYV